MYLFFNTIDHCKLTPQFTTPLLFVLNKTTYNDLNIHKDFVVTNFFIRNEIISKLINNNTNKFNLKVKLLVCDNFEN